MTDQFQVNMEPMMETDPMLQKEPELNPEVKRNSRTVASMSQKTVASVLFKTILVTGVLSGAYFASTKFGISRGVEGDDVDVLNNAFVNYVGTVPGIPVPRNAADKSGQIRFPVCDPELVALACGALNNETNEFYHNALDARLDVVHVLEISESLMVHKWLVVELFEKLQNDSKVRMPMIRNIAGGEKAVVCMDLCRALVASYPALEVSTHSDVGCYLNPLDTTRIECDINLSPRTMASLPMNISSVDEQVAYGEETAMTNFNRPDPAEKAAMKSIKSRLANLTIVTDTNHMYLDNLSLDELKMMLINRFRIWPVTKTKVLRAAQFPVEPLAPVLHDTTMAPPRLLKASQCTAPSGWCTHSGSKSSTDQDCDGDGIYDIFCSGPYGDGDLIVTGFISSKEKCAPKWPGVCVPAQYAIGAKNTNQCPVSSPLMLTLPQCQVAAGVLGATWKGTENVDNYPKSCYLIDDATPEVWFNMHSSGGVPQEADIGSICQEPATTATTNPVVLEESWRQMTLRMGIEAKANIVTALVAMNSRKVNNTMLKWFGNTDDNPTRAEIKRVLAGVHELLSNVDFVYPGSRCGPNTYAYVFAQSPWNKNRATGKFIFYLCDTYMKVNDGEKIETLIHEGAHHQAMYTKDMHWSNHTMYGRGFCEEVASLCKNGNKEACVKALRNADTFCYFVNDVSACVKDDSCHLSWADRAAFAAGVEGGEGGSLASFR